MGASLGAFIPVYMGPRGAGLDGAPDGTCGLGSSLSLALAGRGTQISVTKTTLVSSRKDRTAGANLLDVSARGELGGSGEGPEDL